MNSQRTSISSSPSKMMKKRTKRKLPYTLIYTIKHGPVAPGQAFLPLMAASVWHRRRKSDIPSRDTRPGVNGSL
ncbi:unnamed protein product [Lota lota]